MKLLANEITSIMHSCRYIVYYVILISHLYIKISYISVNWIFKMNYIHLPIVKQKKVLRRRVKKLSPGGTLNEMCVLRES